jgi:hypothetical protein
MALPEAEKDCDAALSLDEGFVKAYIRKAGILFAKRDYMKCVDMCNVAREKDVDGKHAAEIDGQVTFIVFFMYLLIYFFELMISTIDNEGILGIE